MMLCIISSLADTNRRTDSNESSNKLNIYDILPPLRFCTPTIILAL